MKSFTRFALSFLSVLFLLIIFSVQTQAWTEFRTGNGGTVRADETVDNTVFIGSKNVDIAGTVNGDVFCGAQTVNISGTVNGDVICGAQTINISGSVEGDVRLGAQTVNLTGTVSRNATIAAQTINTDSKSQIAVDADFGASDVNLNGNIGRDLAVGGANINIGGSVGRDIKSSADKISLSPSAKVGGGIDYTSRNKISVANGAAVAGQVTQHEPKKEKGSLVKLMFFGGVAALIFALVLLACALVVTALFPQAVHRVSSQGIARPWRSLLVGFIASIVAPIIGVILLFTVVGIPLAILMFIAWMLIAMTSGLFTAYYVGRRVWTSQNNALLRVLAGGAILLILYMIPFIGFLIMLLAFWLGVGMVLQELKTRTPSPKYTLK